MSQTASQCQIVKPAFGDMEARKAHASDSSRQATQRRNVFQTYSCWPIRFNFVAFGVLMVARKK